jgi:5-hydroxyisourate hydrolase-like protein (transthyretin family)
MSWRWIALALLLQATSLQPKRVVSMGSIEGIVVRLGTNEPIEDARVLLMKAIDDRAIPAVMTGRDGKFTFTDLTAGSYRLSFASNGYVRQEFGQRVFPGKGTPIDLRDGQQMNGIVVRMTPTGTVSGRIQDTDGNVLSGVTVQLMRYGYDAEGRQILRSFGKVRTNDLGEYRLYFVTPGRYYLSAGHLRESLGSNEPRETYIAAFYPGAADPRNARLIEVAPGAEIRGVDVTLKRQEKLFVVRGRIISSSTGKAPENIGGLYLNPTDVIENLEGFIKPEEPRYLNGMFEFRNVLPGRYWLSALAYDSIARDRDDRIPILRQGGIHVDVTNSNVEGTEVILNSGSSFSGRLRQEDGTPPSGLFFWNISTGGPPQGADMTPVSTRGSKPDFSNLNDDGTFQVRNVMPGDYVFSIHWLKDQYIKEARFGGVDVLNRPLRFTGAEGGTLEVVLSPNMGAIEGKVMNERLEGLPAAQVVLVPLDRQRTALFRAETTDADGRFRISKIVPGDYTLFAWEALEPYAYFDPELLRRSDSKGMTVHVGELSRQTLNVTAIAAQ